MMLHMCNEVYGALHHEMKLSFHKTCVALAVVLM